jgi:uncharacterized membrane protein YfhO
MSDQKKTTGSKPAGFSLQQFISSRPQWVILFLLMVICFFIFKDFIFQKKIYLFKDIGSDSINIYYPWLTMMSDLLKTDGAPGWCFAQGMGQNVFPLWLGDFFSNFLTYFDKPKIAPGIAYVEILKVILAGFVFFKFLKELKLSSQICILFGLLYAFTGFMMVGGTWTVFSVEALYIAVILFGFERWLNHGKYLWFIAGITCLALLQPFYLFPYGIVLALYIVARYFDTHEKGGKEFIVFLCKTAGLALLAVALTGFQLLPDLLQYLESPRVGGESSFFAKLQKQPMFGVADELLRFTTIFRSFGADMLGNGTNFRGFQNYLEAPVFYCGIICLVLFPQFFTSLSKRQKKIYGVITFLICLPILFPYFRYMFWAFSGDYFRAYSLAIALFLLIYSARALHYIQQNAKVNKIALGVTVLLLLILLFTPNAQFRQVINTDMRSVAAVLLVVYGFFIYRFGTVKVLKENFKLLLLIVCLFEIFFFSYPVINDRDALRGIQLKDKVGYNDYSLDAVNHLKLIDKSFFRVNKDFGSGLAIHGSINDAKVQGFYGTASYFSFNQNNYIKFLGDFGVINVADENSTRWAKGLVDRPILFCLASGKYWITKRTDNAIGQMGYDSIAKFGDVKVYKSRFILPFGFAYDKMIKEDDFKKLSSIQKDFAALRACVISTDHLSDFSSLKTFNLADTLQPLTYDNFGAFVRELKKDSMKITKFSNNHITGNITVNEPKVLFFSFPFDEGWKARLNSSEARLFRVNAGLTGLLINKGANDVELTFVPRLKKKGTVLSLIALLALGGLFAAGFWMSRKAKAAKE